jgi:D-threonate/D-erythronate kinase
MPNNTTSSRQVRLLADDLTGACDAAAAFLKTGHAVRVWFGATSLFPATERTQAFHTASRSLSADEAARAVSKAAVHLRSGADTLFFKKIDSAGRGPIAAEVLAAHRALETRVILLAPGFPAAGRTVRDGILEIRDGCSQDRQVNLREIFVREMRDTMVTISRAGEVAAGIECGKTILVCDSATQDELDALARAAEPIEGLLYAGSAGLAQAIANLHPVPAALTSTAAAARTLIIVGTGHPVTNLQISVLEQAAHGGERVQILRIQCEDRDDAKVRAAFSSFDPEALIVTGGDTAQFAAAALGAHSMLLHGEFAPGIPWGRLQGGMAEGRIAVTKSGGFGSATALNDVIAKLSGVA